MAAVYLIGVVSIADHDAYRAYMDGAFKSLLSWGIEVLAYASPTMIEGLAPGERIVLLRAPDEDSARGWYFSTEYQAVLPIRWANAETPFFISVPSSD